MNEYERSQAEYRNTPAGRWQAAHGIVETRDLAAERAFIAEFRANREAKREQAAGMDPDSPWKGRTGLSEGELRALAFAAERRHSSVHWELPPAVSSYELAARMRWGISTPPRADLAVRPLGSS